MKTLVINTAFTEGRLGLALDGKLISEEEVEPGHLEHSTFPALARLGIAPDLPDIDLIALASGPGSFTGLKIGTVVTKSLSFLQGKPFRGIGTLKWLAAEAGPGVVLTILRSAGNRFYWAVYDVTGSMGSTEKITEICAPSCCEIDGIPDALDAKGIPGLKKLAICNGETASVGIDLPVIECRLDLSVLAHLAESDFASQGSDDPLTFTPDYVAGSQAEEKIKAADTP